MVVAHLLAHVPWGGSYGPRNPLDNNRHSLPDMHHPSCSHSKSTKICPLVRRSTRDQNLNYLPGPSTKASPEVESGILTAILEVQSTETIE